MKSSNQAQKDAQKQIQAQAEAQTKKIIQDRTDELKALEVGWTERIKPLEARMSSLKDDIKVQLLEYEDMRSKVVGAAAELGKTQDQLSTIKSEVARAEGLVQIQETKLAGVQAQVSVLSERIAPLQEEKLKITGELIKLRKDREVAEESLADSKKLMAEEALEHERTVHNLKSESSKLALKIQEDEHQWDIERQQMASRQRKLDLREETLARREQKLVQGERDMVRNSDLMNL